MKKSNIISKLIERFQHGEKETFNNLALYYENYVFRIALKYLRYREDAQDLTQEVFIKLYKSLSDFKFKSDFKTYLYRMTVNMACNYYKKEKRDQTNIKGLASLLPVQADDTNTKYIENETILNLETAVSNLNHTYKTIIMLKDFRELSYKKIAQELNISENAAKIRHHYAVKRLKKTFSAI